MNILHPTNQRQSQSFVLLELVVSTQSLRQLSRITEYTHYIQSQDKPHGEARGDIGPVAATEDVLREATQKRQHYKDERQERTQDTHCVCPHGAMYVDLITDNAGHKTQQFLH